MGLSVVAEGVESDTALNHLKTHSCDLAQGFHMAKPLFNEELLEWIKTSPWGLG
jgi:EAL domain-containing protein (putative c-di-GMP-specific phosphodiesterase class I)